MIKKEGNKYVLYNRDGTKKLGTFSSRKKAVEREQEIIYFKNKRK